MKTPSSEAIRHVVINLVPYHINQINKIQPEEYFHQNDNRDRHDRRLDYRNDRRDSGRHDRYCRDDNNRDRYDRRSDRDYNGRDSRDDRRKDRHDHWRDDRSRRGRGGNRGHGGKRPYTKKPETKYLPNYHVLDSALAEIFKADTEKPERELDFKNVYELYYWMYYSFRQILIEKMSKLSDDLKDEDILIQLTETNESIFQIVIKTGAGDDMNAILAQETIYLRHEVERV